MGGTGVGEERGGEGEKSGWDGNGSGRGVTTNNLLSYTCPISTPSNWYEFPSSSC